MRPIREWSLLQEKLALSHYTYQKNSRVTQTILSGVEEEVTSLSIPT